MNEETQVTSDMSFNEMVAVWLSAGDIGTAKVLQKVNNLVKDGTRDPTLIKNKIADLANSLADDEVNDKPMTQLVDPSGNSPDETLRESIKGTYLLSIEIENFRPYYGKSVLSFSTDTEKPITVLLSPDNGSGKTAFLNALSWGLFGELANPNDSHPENVINYRALAESSASEAIVTTKIRIQDTTYTITRSANQEQAAAQTPKVAVKEETNGEEKTGNIDIFHSYFPKVFRKIFFLAGESINAMQISNTGIENMPFRRGIELLLKTDDFKRSIEALESALTHKFLKPTSRGNQAISRAEAVVQAASKEKEDLEAELELIKTQMEDTQAEITQYQNQAAGGANETALLDEFKQEKKEIEIAEADHNSHMQKLADFISNFAHMIFAELAKPSLNFGISRINQAQDAELIPPRFGTDILTNSLEKNECELCGEELTQQAKARIEAISKFARDRRSSLYATEQRNWLEAQNVRYENKLIEIQEEINEFADTIEVLKADEPTAEWIFSAVVAIRNKLMDNERSLRARKISFEQKYDEEKLAAQNQIIALLVNRSQLLTKQKLRDTKIREELLPQAEKNFKVAEDKLEELMKEDKDNARKAKARHYVTEARSIFVKMSDGLAEKGREDLEREMQKIFSEILPDRDFSASVSEDFQIKYTMRTGESASLSTAQKVLGYGSYAAALSKIAPAYQNVIEEDLWNAAGSMDATKISSCPIVLDAPTTSMVKENERMFLKKIKELLPQIIITTFVEESDIETWSEVADGIGKTALIFVTGPSMATKDLQWLGQSYNAAQPDETLQYVESTIKEIS